jgi:hypothetical protein
MPICGDRAKAVLTLAARLTDVATVRSAPRRMNRNVMLRFPNRLPPFKRKLMMSLSGLARRDLSVLPGSAPANTTGKSAADRPSEIDGASPTEEHRLAA